MKRKGVRSTVHASQRMRERDIAQEEVVLAMHYGETSQSKRDGRRFTLFRMTHKAVRKAERDGFVAEGLEGLTVVTTKDGQTLVTTYWDKLPSEKPKRRKEQDDVRHSLALVHAHRLEPFSTCFHKTEAWLQEHTNHQKAISETLKKELESTGIEFVSAMDALFSYAFPSELPSVIAYYEDSGPQLIELHDRKTLERFDTFLLQFCKLCEATMDV